jgi:hypothetical protein
MKRAIVYERRLMAAFFILKWSQWAGKFGENDRPRSAGGAG